MKLKKQMKQKSQIKKTVKKKPASAKDLSTLSVDGFLGGKFDESDDSDDDTHSSKVNIRRKERISKIDNDKSGVDGDSANPSDQDVDSGDNENDDDHIEAGDTSNDDDDKDSIVAPDSHSHKKSLAKLRDTDPDFYKFLAENDKNLLQFDASESDSEEEEKDDDDDTLHKPPQELEVGSDESDFEEAGSDGEKQSGRVITLKMVKRWQEDLRTDRSITTIRNVVRAFHAALIRVSGGEDKKTTVFKVDGSSVFNAVIQLCVLELQPAIKKFLNLPATGSGQIKFQKGKKKWTKVKGIIKNYLRDLLRLLSGVSSTNILAILMKHCHQLVPFVALFPTIVRAYLKKLVQLWSAGEETVRVLAFLCLLRLTTITQGEFFDKVLKLMYMAYVSNSKFVSPNTLPAINFMRRSLTEMYALDEAASYQHVFLFIRQLAIHLRNAITLQKKETIQAVYNWQFVNSLHLWAELLGATSNKPQLQPLIYPLVQVTMGTIKLIPTAQYYPLRFHCIQILIQLSKNSNTFIPVLPFLLEILNTFDFNKAHKKVSMKPMDIRCVLRLSKSQMQENGFKDVVIDRIYQQLLEYLTNLSYHISFPDLVISTIIQLKKFLKTCKVSNYCKKMRQVLEKIEETSRAVENERRKVSFNLTDQKAIDAWESKLKLKGTPLITFYESWNKIHVQQLAKKATDNDKLGEFNIPVLKKFQKRPNSEPEGPVELFPSDESDSDNLFSSEEPTGEPKTKRGKRGRKGNKPIQRQPALAPDVDGLDDIVEELKLSDLE